LLIALGARQHQLQQLVLVWTVCNLLFDKSHKVFDQRDILNGKGFELVGGTETGRGATGAGEFAGAIASAL
jgi:hypothetical protein